MMSVKINMFFISHLMCNIMLISFFSPLYYLLNMSQIGFCVCVCVCVCVLFSEVKSYI